MRRLRLMFVGLVVVIACCCVRVVLSQEMIFESDFETGQPCTWSAVVPGGVFDDCWITITLPGGVTMDLVLIPAGTFDMGSLSDERGRDSNEDLHQVTLTGSYYVGKYGVTQEQWDAVMGTNPAHDYGVGPDYPVYNVSWDDIAGSGGFIETLNAYLASTSQPVGFRLPTEAEWERAARGETQTEFSFDVSGNPEWDTDCGSFPEAEDYMWWCGNNTPNGSKEVGTKLANGFGLYDMHGNLYEWVEDWYISSLGTAAVTDPTGPATGLYRVTRGGGWNSGAWYCRSAFRSYSTPSYRYFVIGFRLAKTLE